MKKSATLLFFSALFTLTAFTQSIQEGVNHFYAGRNVSAKATFDKMLASNPNNMEAAYWLGQTHIASENSTSARQVYEKALASNGNAPLVLVGMGHVELIEGKTNEARQRFETAISMSRGKKGDDPMVLNAIGRANVESKGGDVAYAIAKLNAAATLAPNNPDIFINLGNAYRKARDGGQAVTNYMKASSTNPALANYRMALIYQTQRNWDIFNDHLNKAIAADAKFAPAYNSQYTYQLLYKKDFAAANAIAQKYINASDPSIQNDYFKAQASFLQKNYDEAIATGKNILSQVGDQASANLYRLLTYSYLAKGDTTTAKGYVDSLFANAKADDIVAQDYSLKADVYSKDYPDQVVQIYLDAASEDTSRSNKMAILQEAMEWAKTNNRKIPEGDIRLEIYKLNPTPNPASLFQIGLPYYQGGNFVRADSVFKAYSAAFPDSLYGYYWTAKSLAAIDTTLEKGLAIGAYEKTLELASLDKVRWKGPGVESSLYLAGYNNNIKKDKATAISYTKRGLEFDPQNATLQNILKVLDTPAAKPTNKTPAKTKTKTPDNKTKTKKKD
ncbi:MAG: tetratricopeptide repeat protein [Bacteroidota bacterium]|nr:tetratricopeptide repeat protein [Bacteroidota bacterium]